MYIVFEQFICGCILSLSVYGCQRAWQQHMLFCLDTTTTLAQSELPGKAWPPPCLNSKSMWGCSHTCKVYAQEFTDRFWGIYGADRQVTVHGAIGNPFWRVWCADIVLQWVDKSLWGSLRSSLMTIPAEVCFATAIWIVFSIYEPG